MAAMQAESPLPAREVKVERTQEMKTTWVTQKKVVKETLVAMDMPPPKIAPCTIDNVEEQIQKVSVVKVTREASKPAKPTFTPGDQEAVVKAEVAAVTQVTFGKAQKIGETQKSPEPPLEPGPVTPTPPPASAVDTPCKPSPSSPTEVVKKEIKKTFEVEVTSEQPKPPLGKIQTKPVAPAMEEQGEASDDKLTQAAPESPKDDVVTKPAPPPENPVPKIPERIFSEQVTREIPKSSSEMITPESAAAVLKAEAAGTTNEVKVTTVTTVQVTMMQTASLSNGTAPSRPQGAAKMVTAAESAVSTGGEKEGPERATSMRKETPVIPVEMEKPAAPPAPAEKAQAPKEAPAPPEVTVIKRGPSPSPETVPSALITPAAAVRFQASAPTDKGKAEPAEFTEENMKQEVPELSSESKPPAAALAAAEAAAAAATAGADASTRAAQGGPPPLTPDSTSPAEHKQDRGAALHKASTERETLAATQPDLATEHDPDPDPESLDPAAMRKKIVVVEEVIEVQHLNAAQADQQQLEGQTLPTGQDPELDPADQEIDIDILTELALERTMRAEAAYGATHHPFPEQEWDHGLDEPEEKSWPNFIEGLKTIQPLSLLLSCVCDVTWVLVCDCVWEVL
ncbi:hypothetical protein AAFF_G00164030 [Aldrovandia affinis]|uniref:Uncharacterized protein n=1 Tax=Aldrovandia affinis TaxID=143900 RepID=A0AAD7SZM4_9TELE|nr:hypothetical protein AAFF_G00164030 [Aldrovandia affinis]